MAKNKKSETKTKAKKAPAMSITMPKKPKGSFDLEINDKSLCNEDNEGYLEFDPKGKDCKIYVDVPNKVGKTFRIRQIGKEGGSVIIRTINGYAKITPKMKFVDLIKMGNVWALIPRYS